MRWIGTVVIVEDNVLLVLAAGYNLRGSGAKFVLDLLDDGNNERCHNRENPHRHLVLELLDDLRQNGDFLDCLADALQEFVVEFDSRHYLLEDLLDILGKLFGLPRRDRRVLHLRVGGIALD